MPKALVRRCQPDSIQEFGAAAHQRFLDGISAAASERRTAAIYLWGYAAEMVLKAAYFRVIGFATTQAITFPDLQAAINQGKILGIPWPTKGQGHNVRAWAQLLVTWRATTPGWSYPPLSFGLQVLARGQLFERLWIESLRYHKNTAYLFEVTQIREATEWLLSNSAEL